MTRRAMTGTSATRGPVMIPPSAGPGAHRAGIPSRPERARRWGHPDPRGHARAAAGNGPGPCAVGCPAGCGGQLRPPGWAAWHGGEGTAPDRTATGIW